GRAVTKGRTTTETATGWTIAAVTGGAAFEAALRTIVEITTRGTITLGARATLRAVAERLSFTVWLLVTIGLLVPERLLVAIGLAVAERLALGRIAIARRTRRAGCRLAEGACRLIVAI